MVIRKRDRPLRLGTIMRQKEDADIEHITQTSSTIRVGRGGQAQQPTW